MEFVRRDSSSVVRCGTLQSDQRDETSSPPALGGMIWGKKHEQKQLEHDKRLTIPWKRAPEEHDYLAALTVEGQFIPVRNDGDELPALLDKHLF